MKTASMVLGIVGGILALLLGLVGYTLGQIGSGMEATVLRIVSLALPVLALIGASIVKTRSGPGGITMIVVAAAMFLLLGVNFASLLPGLPLAVAGVLGVLGERERVA
jgi:hypothetical protein